MPDPVELAHHIRFHLSQLGARNEHHTFEHLCRHLAKARICSNVMPATGPVGSAGDQGCDFETFRSHLAACSDSPVRFLALLREGFVAFTCTLQNSPAKIRSDISKIAKNFPRVAEVHVFICGDLAVGPRHRVKHWAMANHDIQVEIYDPQWISEALVDADTFWIAIQFLRIPSEMAPCGVSADPTDQWYEQAYARWLNWADEPVNLADYVEVRDSLRRTDNRECSAHRHFWIETARRFVGRGLVSDDTLFYEITRIRVKAGENLAGIEDRLRAYFSREISSRLQLEEASALVSYLLVAVSQQRIRVDFEELREWRKGLMARVEERLTAANDPQSASILLLTKGHLHWWIEPSSRTVEGVDETLAAWEAAVDAAEQCPLFPIESLSDGLVILAPFITNLRTYDRVTRKVDAIVSRTSGDIAAAAKCRDRAMAFERSGNLLAAISHLHDAKLKWFNDETLRGSLLSSLLIAQSYRHLGLAFASKYYALGTARLAMASDDLRLRDLIHPSLDTAASASYLIGAWHDFLYYTTLSVGAHAGYSKNPGNLDVHDQFHAIIYNAAIARYMCERFGDQRGDMIGQSVREWGLEEPSRPFWIRFGRLGRREINFSCGRCWRVSC